MTSIQNIAATYELSEHDTSYLVPLPEQHLTYSGGQRYGFTEISKRVPLDLRFGT
jgi:hypothetical protein